MLRYLNFLILLLKNNIWKNLDVNNMFLFLKWYWLEMLNIRNICLNFLGIDLNFNLMILIFFIVEYLIKVFKFMEVINFFF